MTFVSSSMSGRLRHVCIATATAAVLAVAALGADYGVFNAEFEGELWAVQHEIAPGGDAFPAGVAYLNGTLFVADAANGTVTAYDGAGTPGVQWNLTDPDFVPHQLAAAVVNVDGTDQNVILVSDDASNRVAAFDTAGTHLFTLRLERPSTEPTVSLSIGELAMSSGAKFNLNTTAQTLTLSGSFAAAWVEQWTTGWVESGALVFQGSATPYPLVSSEFVLTPTAILRGTESDPVAPVPQRVFGVAYDTAGNLYVLDAFTERLNVYGPDLSHLFTFGTPVADGTTAQFQEPWGLLFRPDAVGAGGRLFINDTYNNRIVIYRPVDGPDAGDTVDALQFESVIDGYAAPDPEPYSIAFDPVTGSIAVTDWSASRVVVLQHARLATFDFQVLDASDGVVDSVCTGAEYKIRFSLTVPAGQLEVTGVVPQLLIDGVPTSAPAVPLDVYPSSTLSAGQVVTFTYTLTAPAAAGADIEVIAGATATNTSDILTRSELIALSDCAAETDPSTITATPSSPPQVSGWTPVFQGETFTVTLAAQDDDGIESIEFQLEGAYEIADDPLSTPFDGVQTDASVVVAIENPGNTTLRYRVRDGHNIWSAWQTLDLRLVLVTDRQNNENTDANFAVGAPIGSGFTFCATGLPPGITINPGTGQIAGIVGFDAAGVYTVVVTERLAADCGPGPAPSSSVTFTWTVLNINQHPVIEQPAVTPATEGEFFSLQIVGYDPDGDAAFFTAGYDLPPSITINPATGLISGVFPFNAQREYTITVGLSECAISTPANPLPNPPCTVDVPGERLATLFSFKLEVINVNFAPLPLNPGPQSNTEGDTVTLPIVASDPDLETLTYAASGLPQGLSIDANTGVISGTLSATSAGSHAVTVSVSDGIANPAPAVTFAWTVAALNEAPTASAPPRTDNENTTVSFAITSNDADGDPLAFSATGLPPGISIDPVTGVISGTLSYATAGVYGVVVTVSDGALSATAPFAWTVTNVNAPPTVTNPGHQTNAEGNIVSVQVTATDFDNDALVYTAIGLPPGLLIHSLTGVIAGTLDYNSAGTYTGATVTVSDGSLNTSVTFTWTVTNVNRPPDVIKPADQSSATGATIALPVIATDPDLQALTYSATGLPSGLSIHASTGVISGTIAASAGGNYNVTVSASDGTVADSETFTWVVTNTNQPPVCTATATPAIIWPPNHKKVYLSVAGATDPEGAALTIRYSGILQDEPTNSVGDGNTPQDGGIENDGASAWVRAERSGTGDGRVYLVSYSATDGTLSCTGVVTVSVPHDQSGAPAVLSPGRWNSITGQQVSGFLPPDAVNDTVSVKKGQAQTVNVLSNDIANGQTLTVALVTPPSIGTATVNANGTITYQPPPTVTGTTSFTYNVTTPGGGTDTATVTVTIKK